VPLPAPTPLAARPTVALACLGEFFPADSLRDATAAGISPVFMHRLTGEDGSADDGPRELLAATAFSLEKAGFRSAWGAGCVVRNAAEAASFVTAGYTWFSFELTALLDIRADSMSLDELDAAVVALEDSRCYAPGWHEHYTDREWPLASGKSLRLPDEELARAAVKHGRALAHADLMQQAIRTVWSGHGMAPDIELCLGGRQRWKAGEFLFLALETARRGLNPACIAPSLGPAWQPGAEFADEDNRLDETLTLAAEIFALAGSLKFGIHHAAGKAGVLPTVRGILGARCHLDFEEDTWLAVLGSLATRQPDLFRRWLALAQEAFPVCAAEFALAITEEDIRALPQVADLELPATFLAAIQGRQLLLSTFPEVLRRDRSLRSAITPAQPLR